MHLPRSRGRSRVLPRGDLLHSSLRLIFISEVTHSTIGTDITRPQRPYKATSTVLLRVGQPGCRDNECATLFSVLVDIPSWAAFSTSGTVINDFVSSVFWGPIKAYSNFFRWDVTKRLRGVFTIPSPAIDRANPYRLPSRECYGKGSCYTALHRHFC